MIVVAPSGFESLPILENPLRIPVETPPVAEAPSRQIETASTLQSTQTQRRPTSFMLQTNGPVGPTGATSSESSSDNPFRSLELLSGMNVWEAINLSGQNEQTPAKPTPTDFRAVAGLYENVRPALGSNTTITA